MNAIEARLLCVFEEIYKTRSVTSAALALGLGQPAVRIELSKLREHFGNPLFVRTSNGMEPTPFGEKLVGPVRAALDALDVMLGFILKATSSLVGMSHGVSYNQAERRTDHEVELVIVIGKTCKNVSKSDALSCVAGYSVGLDMTIRGPEERSLRKSPDTYTVLGPWFVTADEVLTPGNLEMGLLVNGEARQKTNTSELILGVEALIEFASRFYTLHPGDLIFTGTPEGVGPVQAGDKIHAFIKGIGELDVEVRGEEV